MANKTKILLFEDEKSCQDILSSLKEAMGIDVMLRCINDLEELMTVLVDWDPNLIVVAADGAEGMECVYQVRERQPCLPVFWFSNDQDFSVLSYRLECAYFSTKPVTVDKIRNAISRCRRLGIRYTE